MKNNILKQVGDSISNDIIRTIDLEVSVILRNKYGNPKEYQDMTREDKLRVHITILQIICDNLKMHIAECKKILDK